MIVAFTIVRYRKSLIPLALFAMALHRLPLYLNKKCSFWKLFGSGKNGTFSLTPDWQQWGLISTWPDLNDWEDFDKNSSVSKWWKRFCTDKFTMLCSPVAGHGKWDEKEPFKYEQDLAFEGPVVVLTRATIRISKLKDFWQHVNPVADVLKSSAGFITSFGIGEAPVYKQATISIWESLEHMKSFSYQSKEHAEVIKKTRTRNWYKEELFARFALIKTEGSLAGINPITKETI